MLMENAEIIQDKSLTILIHFQQLMVYEFSISQIIKKIMLIEENR